jgi:hypothetical protein
MCLPDIYFSNGEVNQCRSFFKVKEPGNSREAKQAPIANKTQGNVGLAPQQSDW